MIILVNAVMYKTHKKPYFLGVIYKKVRDFLCSVILKVFEIFFNL
jgi:hypothetical protein